MSALCLPLDQEPFRPYQHHIVDIDDVEDENVLQHFPATNTFIAEGLKGGGGVLVHWYVRNGIVGFMRITIVPNAMPLIFFSLSLWY